MTACRRIQVDDHKAGRAPRTTVVYVPDEVDPAIAEMLAPVVERMMANLDSMARTGSASVVSSWRPLSPEHDVDPGRRRSGVRMAATGRGAYTVNGWQGWPMSQFAAYQVAVSMFRDALLAGELSITVEDAREQLAGRDLACWCPPRKPCHADALLEVANDRSLIKPERDAGHG